MQYALRGDIEADSFDPILFLGEYLPFLKPPAKDFFFQINRPRKSTALRDGTEINRLSRWSVMPIGISVGDFSPASIRTLQLPRVEIDVNNAPVSEGTVPPDSISDLVSELGTVLFEIATKGDIP